MQYNSRKEVPEKYKWDLTAFFKNEEDFQKCFKETEELISKLEKYKGCTKDAEKLYEFLVLEVDVITRWENLYVYAYLINDQELGISENSERKQKTEKLNTTLCNNISFFAPELLKLTKEEYEKLFETNKKLIEYKADLDKIYRKKEHILSEEKENIVNSLVQSMDHFEDLYSNLKNNELDYGTVVLNGEKIKIACNNYRKLMKEKDENLRKKVHRQFNKRLESHEQTFAMLLNSYVSMEEQIAKIYNFKNAWEKKLFGYNITNKVYDSLVKTTLSNLRPINRYYELKAKVQGKKQLNTYDLALALVDNDKKYTIEEAQELTLKAIKPLGEEYYQKFKKIYDNHYIDYCQYKGKCSGGYSFSTALNDSRILMSYNDDLDSVSTIIHEGGHNVNHQYLKEYNPVQYRDNTSIVAEVASLTNECLLSSYLADNGTTKEEKLSGIANIMDVIVSNLYGAVREGHLEQEMHKVVEKNGMISADFLNKKSRSSLKKYYGNSVKVDRYTKTNWITRSHYYMNYYLYSYSISISVATSIAKKILSGDKKTLNNYIEFLKCGSNKWPQEAFEILGVNLEDKNVYQDACNYLDELIDKYYEILSE